MKPDRTIVYLGHTQNDVKTNLKHQVLTACMPGCRDPHGAVTVCSVFRSSRTVNGAHESISFECVFSWFTNNISSYFNIQLASVTRTGRRQRMKECMLGRRWYGSVETCNRLIYFVEHKFIPTKPMECALWTKCLILPWMAEFRFSTIHQQGNISVPFWSLVVAKVCFGKCLR